MKTRLRYLANRFGLLLGTTATLLVPPSEAALGSSVLLTPQPRYEQPTNAVIATVLDHCLADFSRAQQEIATLHAEGNLLHGNPPTFGGGFFLASMQRSNAIFTQTFASENGPPLYLQKTVYTRHGSELHGLGYSIYYRTNGLVKSYSSRDDRKNLWFNESGGLTNFWTEIDSETAAYASWDADGKLLSEGLSLHLPTDEKGLPRLEEALRHGDAEKKTEATRIMAEIGPPSIPYALRVLQDGDESSRESAASVFGLLRDMAVPAIPALVRSLEKDSSPSVRKQIALSLGLIGAPAAVAIPALEKATAKDAPEVATVAKFALERIRRPSSK